MKNPVCWKVMLSIVFMASYGESCRKGGVFYLSLKLKRKREVTIAATPITLVPASPKPISYASDEERSRSDEVVAQI